MEMKKKIIHALRTLIAPAGFLLPLVITCTALHTRLAQAAPALPQRQIPPAIIQEVKQLENQFEMALMQDCGEQKCYSRGCQYLSHETVDRPRESSLPGIGEKGGLGEDPPQQYLTGARCEFVAEKTVPVKNLTIIRQRLEQRLSRGFIVVSVVTRHLPALPDATEPDAVTITGDDKTGEPLPQPDKPEPRLTWNRAVNDLWSTMLPHVPWILAVILGTLAVLTVILGWRRLGRISPEDEILMQQMTNSEQKIDGTGEKSRMPPPQPLVTLHEGELPAAWRDELKSDPERLRQVGDYWLAKGEYALLAKAALELGWTNVSESGLTLAGIEFSDFFRSHTADDLPPNEEFGKRFHYDAVYAHTAAALPGAQIIEELEAFGVAGLTHLVEQIHPVYAAFLFTLIPKALARPIASRLSATTVTEMVRVLSRCDRLSARVQEAILRSVTMAASGEPLPAEVGDNASVELQLHGEPVPAAQAVSRLIGSMSPADRRKLVATLKNEWEAHAPLWIDDLFFPELLLHVPTEPRGEILLTVPAAELSLWIHDQHSSIQEALLAAVPEVLRKHVARPPVVPAQRAALMLQRAERLLSEGVNRWIRQERMSLLALVQQMTNSKSDPKIF